MKVNVDATLKALDGTDIKIDADRLASVRTISIDALLSVYPSETPSGEESFKRYSIAQRINTGGEVELTAEEIALVKRLVGLRYGPIIVGPFYNALEGR